MSADAKRLLAGQPIHDFTESGSWFNCTSFTQNGSFVDLAVIHKQNGEDVIVDISIPVHYVAYTIGADAAKTLGFTPRPEKT